MLIASLISLLLTGPDTTSAVVSHTVKLGLTTTANGQMPTLALERQLRPRLTLQSRLGYGARTFREFYTEPLPNDPLHSEPYSRRVRQAEASAQLRYFLGRHPQPLTGVYAGLGIGLAHVREVATRPQGTVEKRTRLLLYPQLLVGGQCVFGRHFLLDAFLGLGVAQRQDFAFVAHPRNVWDFYAANGLQVGYAF
jgi:hypothetical protein